MPHRDVTEDRLRMRVRRAEATGNPDKVYEAHRALAVHQSHQARRAPQVVISAAVEPMELEPYGWQLTDYRLAVERYVSEGTVEAYADMVDSVTPHVAEFLSRLERTPAAAPPRARRSVDWPPAVVAVLWVLVFSALVAMFLTT